MRVSAFLLALLAVGCPPPHFVDIFNNTGSPLEIGASHDFASVAPGESARVMAWALFHRWATSSTGTPVRVVRVKVGERCVAYRIRSVEDAWVRKKGSLTAGLYLQVDPDLSLRVAPGASARPIPSSRAQPKGWPLRPHESARDASESSWFTFFRLAGRGRKSVFIDEKEVARLPSRHRFTIRVSPGTRSISGETLGNDPVVVHLEADEHYFMRLHKKFWAVGEDVELVEQHTAEVALQACAPNPCELNFDDGIHDERPDTARRSAPQSRHNNGIGQADGGLFMVTPFTAHPERPTVR